MIPSIGRIVHYKLNESDVHTILHQRADAHHPHGNPVYQGDTFPMMITKIWAANPDEDTTVQGQVFLDGNDTLWVTSALQGEGERQWSDPRKT